jgi:predicted dehydrogenase
MNFSRRDFLASVGIATAWSTTAKAEPARSASNIVRVGVIGVGVRGKNLIGNLPESVRVTAICDCATMRIGSTLEPQGSLAPVLQRFKERDAANCVTYQDYRRLIDREKLDAVIIATPDHHHSLAAMLALRAGLDVYLEKPLTVYIREGRLLVEMVQRTGRVLQVGSQQRTMEVNRFACEFIRSGGLGKISKVELPCYPGPISQPAFAEEAPVNGIDWDVFCGPTPLRPHHRNLWMKEDFKVGGLLWRGWDLFRDYSGHLMTNWGAHSIDMVQLALGRDDSGPVEIRAVRPESIDALARMWQDKTPGPSGDDSDRRFWPVTMKYEDGIELQFAHGPDFIIFHGERGILKMRRNYFETDPPGLVSNGPDATVADKWKGDGHIAGPHLQNWLDAIRTGSQLNAPVEAGHRTATICHLANLARELNQPLAWSPQRETFVGGDQAQSQTDRPRRPQFEF